MKKLVAAGLVAGLLGGGAISAELGDVDDPIRLAINEWTGQHVATHIGGRMLAAAGYKVEYVSAGYMSMFDAMADGDVHAALEIWTSNVSERFAQLETEGKVVDISGLGLDAREGFAYPAHVAEICPGLPDWEALRDCAGQFATAETLPMGRLLDYPADWGTPGADRVAGLELPFKAVPAGSEGALITEIRAAVEKKSPLLVVFWQPHWAVSAFDLKWVALPAGTPECYDDPNWGSNPNATADCDFIPSRIFKAGWAGLKDKWPAAHEILEGYTLSTEDQQPLMGAIDVDGRPLEEVVDEWMAANEAKWKPVVDSALN